MAILQKNEQGAFQSTGGVGEVGQWVDEQNGISYSGPKRKTSDVAYKSLVGQQQNLSQNPTIPVAPQNPTIPVAPQNQTTSQIPIAPQQNQVVQSQGDNQSPMDKFNMAILDMLQRAQGTAGNEDLYARQRELQRKQIGSGIDYSGTEGLSPSAQENIASARGGEYSTEIDSIGAKIKANDSRLQNFESILGKMREIGQDIKIKPSDEILQKYVNMIEAGGSLSSVPDEFQEYVMKLTSPETWKKQAAAIAKAKSAGSGGGGLTPAQINATVNSIANAFDNEQIVKNYNEVANKAKSIEKIIDSGVGGPGDLALVFEFMKGLDPTSVVRESEYAAAAASGNIFRGVLARFNGYLKEEGGFLPENVKAAFFSIVKSKLDISQQQYDNVYDEYQRQIRDAYAGKPRSITQYSGAFDNTEESSNNEIPVKKIETGETGWILESEFDDSVYEKLNQ